MIKKPYGKNSYCGPAVLSMVLDIPTDEAAARFRDISGKRTIKWVSRSDMHIALDRAAVVESCEYFLKDKPPTLNAVADTFRPSGVYVLLITGHFIVVHAGKVYDNGRHRGELVRRLGRRRVRALWRLVPSVGK